MYYSKSFYFWGGGLIIFRKEIQATLERLKRAESNLTAKERELMEREIKLIEREKTLEQQFKTVVRYPDI